MTDHALLLVNLGSPASTKVEDVRSYLDQFLMDPYVVDLPWPLRRLLVSLILIKRPAQSAHAYSSIWWPKGSPLIVLSRELQDAIAPHWPHGPVELAMRYGQPSIESALRKLAAQGVKRVTLAPLYPQFADSTTTTAIEEARRVIREQGLKLEVSVLPPFFAEADYLEALVASAKPYLDQGFDHLLLSFHGLPERHIRKLVKDIDPQHDLRAPDSSGVSDEVLAVCYRSQCQRTAEAFAERAGLQPGQWSVSFQSRLGKDKWIEPYTETRLDELAKQGVKKLLVMCPAFVADCIETLEEIGQRGSEQFQEAGGQELVLVPCMNSHPQWVSALVKLCETAVRPL
ncbi:ferrochelatase [Pseudomonas sp. BN411]|uniref:ferrochelatase n=1 Tax=Pseudomonas sp. BN411 TaxID=2567887 RepID=UPI002455561D|nr:ferrochelatase [Pseudomonas sp. BN411]MDH4561841.1 ferrochelatase [Pseudomonas sp. BN411]